ncbi:hypothetical protein F8G81_16130 [Arthrobacter sp. CDRTa11]|uniref:hypothetical protein n=1 Tax=Arthrobacter sp. CDRTa11 TaxID=2651199 RepID=UPI0022659C66|nr:hypothetical protein [Arthrobacter sp. CDRTa11]UZX03957.1 hypothetical protein F8G81_16130 [Arthrobacter sp. CDRTa11]
MTMVKYRSELSRSRAGIHGGLRRGAAGAAVGAVLVLSAGVTSSQADEVSPDSGESGVQITGTVQLSALTSLAGGLLDSGGTAGSQPSRPATTTAPAPTGTVSPSQVPSTPIAPATSPAPSTSSVPPLTSGAQQGTAAGTGAVLQPPLPQSGAVVSAPEQAPAQPEAAQPEVPAEAGAGQASTAPSPTAGQAARSGTLQAAGSPAVSRQAMTQAPENLPETAKVWLGLGLVGSAGAAGLVFAKIRRL